MQLRILLGTLAAFALLGAGCARTTPSVAPEAKVPATSPSVATPRAEAPALPAEALPPPPLPPTQPPAPDKPKAVPTPIVVGTPTASVGVAPTPTPPPPSPTPAPTPEKVAAPVAPAPKPATHAVTIKGFAFGPAALTVKAGDTVVWTQEDSAPHNIVADDGSSTGPLLSPGQTYTRIFTTKGVFAYHCGPHPFMKASVVVE